MSARSALVAVLLLASSACAQLGVKEEPESARAAAKTPAKSTTAVELTVNELREGDLDALKAELAKNPDFEGVAVKSSSGTSAVLSLRYRGEAGDVEDEVTAVKALGLKPTESKLSLTLQAFDNKAPTIAFLHPQPEIIWTKKELDCTVDVPDKDVAEVMIDGKPATRVKGTVYRARLSLPDGEKELVATVKDRAGNSGEAKVKLTVDTTAPAIEATLKLIVEGKVEPGSAVLINGLDIEVDRDGDYRAEVEIRKGQRRVEIVAIDSGGNRSTSVKTIGE